MEEKEIINQEEQPVEEQPEQVQEDAPVEAPEEAEVVEEEPADTAVEIKKPDPNGKPYAELVEEERVILTKQAKKSSRISTISIIVVVAISIGGVFTLNIIPVLAYILMGLAIACLIASSIVIRRITKPDVQGYIVKASTAINEFVFADNRFTDVKYDPSDKLELGEVANDGVYVDLVKVASRNLVEGYYNGRSFKVCESAFFKAGANNKQQNAVFIGKYLTMTNNLHFEGRILLISKGETDTDLPDITEDLVQVEADDKFYIYGPNENCLKVLDKKFLKAIKDIKVVDHLMNLTVVIWAGRTMVYASYDDATITLPFYEKYQADTAVQYRENLLDILDALEILNKE